MIVKNGGAGSKGRTASSCSYLLCFYVLLTNTYGTLGDQIFRLIKRSTLLISKHVFIKRRIHELIKINQEFGINESNIFIHIYEQLALVEAYSLEPLVLQPACLEELEPLVPISP
eukprot:g32569.t1